MSVLWDFFSLLLHIQMGVVSDDYRPTAQVQLYFNKYNCM